ncbi:ras-related protein RabC-like [Symsagittifera roscoffensis]|uniref:ras-related protein RabC-like n=1 Tax=Symsagittifera roscoffensis TaxID=84072 RepID=UPI00307BCEFE
MSRHYDHSRSSSCYQAIFSYKIVLLGASGVGKSSICQFFTKGEFSDNLASTVGATFHLQKIQLQTGKENGESVTLKVWDTAGQERFNSLLPMYYNGSQGAFVVYDITRYVSQTRPN